MTINWKPIRLIGLTTLFLVPAWAFGENPNSRLSSGIERAKQATVGILSFGEDTAPQSNQQKFSVRGTGVHFGEGSILTARHAVERPEGGKRVIPQAITILTEDLEELPANLSGVNVFLDIAVYHIDQGTNFAALGTSPLGSREPKLGDEVFTVGYPLGWGPTLAFGRVGNLSAYLSTVQSRLMQVDLSACSGNSGGGLFNEKGEIIGMVHAIIQTESLQGERRCSRFAFAVPGPLLQRMATAVMQGTILEYSKLGIRMTAVKMGNRWQVAVAKATGPARHGGLRKGDILLSIEGQSIQLPSQLKNYLIEHTQPGQRIVLRALRGRKELELFVTLGKS